MKSMVILADLTYDCSLRCSYCYISGGEKKEIINIESAYEGIKKICEKYKCTIHVVFHGGEPLLCFNLIVRLIESINNSGFRDRIKYYMQTNCINVTNEIAEYLQAHNICIGVSLDGIDIESNKNRVDINGNSSLEKVINGIEILNKANISISVLSVLTKANYKQYSNMMYWMANNNITQFALNPLINAGRSSGSNMGLSGAEMFNVYKEVLYNCIKLGIKERNLYHMYNCIVRRKRTYMCMNLPCGAGLSQFAIDPCGKVYPCADFCGQVEFCLGSVYDNFLDKLGESQSWRQLRSINRNNITECSLCEYKEICPSGCSARSYYSNNIINGIDPLCDFYKLIIPFISSEEVKNIIGNRW